MAKCSFYETRGWSGKNWCLKKNDYVDNKIYYDYCNTYRYDDCPIYKSGSGSGGCYLTTACVEHRGLSDSCIQLETLREFRDGYMAHVDGGLDEIKEYYEKAPKIVSAINNSPDAEELLEGIYVEVIEPCVKLIEEGKNEEAHEKYRMMVKELEAKLIQ